MMFFRDVYVKQQNVLEFEIIKNAVVTFIC